MSTHDTTAAPPAATTRWARAAENRWAALPVVLAGTFMVVLDFFIVNVALPAMQSDLHASETAIEWVVAGYGLTSAIGLITFGRLGDRAGRLRIFSLGLALFTLASLACGVAPSSGALVVARLAQGLAAAMMTPQVLSIIGVVYAGEDRVKALSTYGMVMGLAAVGGQLIGGALVQADLFGLGWRSCFLINVPIGVAALVLGPKLVPESRAERAQRIDLVGTLLSSLFLVALLLPLVEGRQHGWPTWTWLSFGASAVLFGAFVASQRRRGTRGGAPLLELAMFRSRSLSAGLIAQLVLWMGQASFFLVYALYLQQGRGLNALQAGLVFTMLAAAYLGASMRAPALTMRLGRVLPAIGGVVLAAGHAAFVIGVNAVGDGGALWALIPGMVLVGAGMGLTITPIASIVMTTVSAERAGALSGVLASMQQVGNAIGVAVVGVIFFGALGGGFAHAFRVSEWALVAVGLALAALTRLLPSRRAA